MPSAATHRPPNLTVHGSTAAVLGGNEVDLLVGRTEQLASARLLAGHVAHGRGRIILISGEPGSGKTSLLAALAAECARHGVRTFTDALTDLNCQSLTTADAWSGPDARAAGDLDTDLGHPAQGSRVRQGAGSAIRAKHSAGRPLADLAGLAGVYRQHDVRPRGIFVDNLEQIDAQGAAALHRLGQATEELPLLLACAYLPISTNPDLDRLLSRFDSRLPQRLTLGPLSDQAVAELVRRAVGARPTTGLLDTARRAAGNPRCLTELMTALTSAGQIIIGQDGAHIGPEVPPIPGAVFRQALRALSPDTLRVLRVAAALGTRLDVLELAATVRRPASDLLAMLDEATAIPVVVDRGTHLEFRHELMRETLLEGIPASARHALRQQVTTSLISIGAPAARIADCLVACETWTPDIADWLAVSIDALIADKPNTAVQLLEYAVRRLANEPARQLSFQISLARGLLLVGDLDKAEATVRLILAVSPGPDQEGEARCLLAKIHFDRGDIEVARRQAMEAAVRPGLSDSWRRLCQALIAHCWVYLGLYQQAEEVILGALPANAGEKDMPAGDLLATLAMIRYRQGRVVEARNLATEAIALRGQYRSELSSSIAPHLVRALCELDLGRVVEARTDLSYWDGLPSHTDVDVAVYHLVCGRLSFLEGSWDAALDELSVVLGIPASRYAQVTVSAAVIRSAIILHRGGQVDFDKAMFGEPTDAGAELMIKWITGLRCESQGDLGTAHTLLSDAFDQVDPSCPNSLAMCVLIDFLRLSALMPETSAPQRERLVMILQQFDAYHDDMSITNRAMCAGVVRRDPHRLRAAAAAYQAAGRPLFAGYAQEIAAVMFADVGQGESARAALSDSLKLFSDLAAVLDRCRVSAALRRSGIRHGVSGPRRRPKTGWDALTETEHRIALLIAEGRSNPEIASRLYISPRTVQVHVSHIFAKLAVGNRVEAALVIQQASPRSAEGG